MLDRRRLSGFRTKGGVTDIWTESESVGVSEAVLCGPAGNRFRPHLVFFLGNNTTTWNTTPSRANDLSLALGFAYDGSGGIEQSCFISNWPRLGATDADAEIRNDRACGIVDAGASRHLQVTAFNTDGFQAVSSGASISFDFLAVRFSDGRACAVDVETLPSATGTQAFTGPGFPPVLVVNVASLLTTVGSLVDGPTASAWGLGAFTGAAEGAASTRHEEGITPAPGTPTDSDDRSDAKSVLVIEHLDGALAVEANRSSIDAAGYTLNFTTATAGRMVVLAIGAGDLKPVYNETVAISDQAILLLRQSVTYPTETVAISDSARLLTQAATLPDTDTVLAATKQGGAAKAKTFQGGSEIGRTS